MAVTDKEAVDIAKCYVERVFADEHISNLGLEEIELDSSGGGWLVTVAFSRPWNSPRSRAQQTLEELGAFTNQRRSYKVLTISPEGTVLSMRSRSTAEVD